MSLESSPLRAVLAPLAILLAPIALVGGCGASGPRIEQPLNFSHAVHDEQDTACLDCHLSAEEGVYATIPGIKTCLLCHEEPQGESEHEPMVREYAEQGEPIPWVQVNHVEGHVYFSHAPHMVLAEMECADCHGEMTSLEEPPGYSQVSWLTMKACMDCHEERGASNDCLLCHK